MRTTFLVTFSVLFALFCILTVILEYHWVRHIAKRMILLRMFYYGGSLFFFACMGIAVTGIL